MYLYIYKFVSRGQDKRGSGSRPVVHGGLEDVDELLVAGELGGDDGEDVPVVLLHDVEHQQCLLLDGGAKLEERRLVILRERARERKRERE